LERVGDSLRMEPKRARSGLVAHSSVSINQVEPVGPACIGSLRRIVKRIDYGGEFDPQFHHAELADLAAFVEALRARKHDVVVEIVGVLPHITGVRFEYVHHVERDAGSVFLVKLIESGNLPPERRSRVTAKNQHDGFFTA
jgi:hypothetical protein